MGEGANIAARFAQYLCLLALFGAAAFGLYAPLATTLWPLRRWLAVAAAGGLVSAALVLMVQTALMSGSAAAAVDPVMLWRAISLTQSGHAWLVRVAALTGALVVLVLARGRLAWAVAFAGLAVATLAWSGHGAENQGVGGAVHLAVDIVHLLAASLWVGALLGFSALMFKARGAGDDQGTRIAQETLARFAGLGSLLVATLITTGLGNTAFLVDGSMIVQLPAQTWGRVLLVKLALVAAMVCLAGVNRFVLTPRLRWALTNPPARAGAIGRLRLSVLFETGLGLLVLGLVAWLGVLPPPIEG